MFGSSDKNKNAEFVGKVQAARQQRAEEKEREKAAIQIQVCIVSFYFFHFRTLSYFLIIFDTGECFFLHFTYPSDFVSFYFGALQAWVRRFICVGRLRAEIRYRKVRFNF